MEAKTKIGIGLVVFLLSATLTYGVLYRASENTKQITVDEKWVKYHNDDAKYLFSDTEGNVYSIEDTPWLWSWNSSDRYALIKANTTYEITTYGWRIPFLSCYPNAVYIKEV